MKKNENFDVDMLLKQALKSPEAPSPELIHKVKYQLNQEDIILKKPNVKRSFSALTAAVITLMLLTTTAFAAWHFLKPEEVANQFNDNALSAAFRSDTAVIINDSIVTKDYIFTLLGLVSGKDLTDFPTYADGNIQDDRTYCVVATQKADGSPMPSTQDPDYGNPSFYVSPYVKGLKPWQVNAHTLNGGYSETVLDGIMYRILECNEIAMFADRGVYLGINTGSFYDSKAFIFDENTGELTTDPSFNGVSVLFTLPLDKALADPQKAQKFLDDLLGEESTEKPAPNEPSSIEPQASAPSGDNAGSLQPSNQKEGSKPQVMTYDEYKAWTERKIAEAEAMIAQGKYSKSSLALDRRDYEENLKDIKNGAILTLFEHADGSYQTSLTFPSDKFNVEIGDDGGIYISE